MRERLLLTHQAVLGRWDHPWAPAVAGGCEVPPGDPGICHLVLSPWASWAAVGPKPPSSYPGALSLLNEWQRRCTSP